jgi:hypothetical protein
MVHAWSSAADTGATLHRAWTLPPGAEYREAFLIPAYPTEAARLSAWASRSHAERARAVRAGWNAMLERGTRLSLSDPEVERAWRAALVVLLECRERRGPLWVPIGNPLQYRDVWLRDGARAVQALSVAGFTAEARALARGFLEYQWPQGAFLSQRGQLDGTGQALWAFGQAWLRPPAAADSLEPYARAAQRAVRWCEWQRGLGRSTGWTFGALLPAAEPRDNEAVRAQLVGNDAWAIAGYHAAARLLRAGGHAAEADSVETAAAAYRADFTAALSRAGAPDVPPSWQHTGRDWGNLSAAWPCGVLSPSDPRVAALERRVWAAAGGAGLASYGHADSLHYYLGADLATVALLAGNRAAADSVLAAMLAWRSASGGAAELFSRASRDFGMNLPPHATSAAVLVALLRNSLVFDDGDTLRLTLGARPRWWEGGAVHGAPTAFGPLDLEFARRGDQATWRWTPVAAWTALTLPPGTRVAGTLAAPLRPGPRDDVVLAPPRTAAATVALAERAR